ncbi:VpsP family polysaccharide biosynthesis protein [Ningiella sp. W23]|uniref:VpsP family polysaccharide biosynthesis protein n=1 Tax=Ningiella sp. W23 TaxID=3023715 RepID=UPI00375843E7
MIAIDKTTIIEWTALLKRQFSKTKLTRTMLICFAVLGALSALRFGAASLNYHHATNGLAQLKADRNELDADDFESIRNAATQAEFYHASHPFYADISAQVDEWSVVLGINEASALDEAKDKYLRATHLRPSWPVTWGSLAMIKWRKKEFDQEMLKYLKKADKLGPHKPEVHILFARLGLALYSVNHPMYKEIREQTQRRVVEGLRHPKSRRDVRRAIKNTKSMDFACAWSKQQNQYVFDRILKCA